jgi:hypothetical protein
MGGKLLMNWKGSVRKRSWPNFKLLSLHSSGWSEKNHENVSQDSRSPGQRFEHRTSRTRSRSVNHSPTTFGGLRQWEYKVEVKLILVFIHYVG